MKIKKILPFLILFAYAPLHAESKQSPYVLLYTTNTWYAAQIGLGQYPNWLIDGSFIGPNQPGVYTITFKSLLVNGDMNIFNAYGTIDQ